MSLGEILTDAEGNPLAPPEPPEPGAPIEDVIAYLRASCEHNDRVAALASMAFGRQFLRGSKA